MRCSRILLVFVVGSITTACGEVSGDRPPQTVSMSRYETATVDIGDIRAIVPAVGTLRAASEVEVGAEISGRILEIPADFNDPVAEGDLLARIDPSPFQSALRQAEAQLEIARADARAAAADLAAARDALDRLTQLAERGASAQAPRRDQTFVVERLEAALQRANANVNLAEGRVEQARIDLARTEIRSPVTGFVLDRRIEQGQAVNAVQSAPTLFVVATDLSDIMIEAQVSEADIGRIDRDMEVRFKVDAFPTWTLGGVIEDIRRAPVRVGRFVSYTVLVRADREPITLLPGMTASVEFVRGEASTVMRVPVAALYYTPDNFVPEPPQEIIDRREAALGPLPEDPSLRRAALTGMDIAYLFRQGKRRVFRAAPNGPEAVLIRVGAQDDDYIELIEEEGGLQPGDEVIIDEMGT
ncbi:MAG: efflux RND transporter periplasmic adaptor subunit [Alphaproteobacteria bacterium]|nr:efflux RND transporter periplasmic adaptor subunit [Alphaproteobacteria bacterium]